MTTNKGDRQDEAPPTPPVPSNTDVPEPHQSVQPKVPRNGSSKDCWDKAQIFISGLSGVVLVILGIVFTIRYNNRQSDLNEIQIVNGFIEHLSSSDPSRQELALLGLASLKNQDLVVHLAAHPSLSNALNHAFLRVVCDGDRILVNRFLKAGVQPVNVYDLSYKSALMWAADKGDLSIVKCIVKNPSPSQYSQDSALLTLVNASDALKQTAVHWALRSNHPDVAEYLIANGYRDKGDYRGETALMIASRAGYQDVVEQLLGKRGNPNLAPSDEGWTPLMYASMENHLSVAKCLLKHGANIDATTKHGWSALSSACNSGQTTTAKYLVDHGASLNIKDHEGRTPLINAAIKGFASITDLLIEKGVELDLRDNADWTALMHATRHGHKDIVQALTNHGASRAGIETAQIACAAEANDIQLLQQLIRQTENINLRDDKEKTALMIAAEKGNIEAIIMLISAKANLSLQTSSGSTALHLAFDNNRTEAAKLLIDSGAPTQITDESGVDAFLQAASHGCIEIVKKMLKENIQLEKKNNAGETALFLAVKHGQEEIVQILLNSGANPNCSDNRGDTPLMVIGLYDFDRDVQRNARIAQALINAHADIEAKNSAGYSVLFHSFGQLQSGVLPVLLQNKVNVKTRDPLGKTILMYCAQRGSEDYSKMMVSFGVDATAKDLYGLTALDYAKTAGSRELIEYLREITPQATQGVIQ